MKILYIAKRGEYNVPAKMHLCVLKDLFGKENVYVVDLLNSVKEDKYNYRSYGYNKYSLKRIGRWIQGNTGFISNSIIQDVLGIIKRNDIGMVFSEESDLGNLLRVIKTENSNIKIICFYHDITAQLFRVRRTITPKWRIHELIECELGIRQEFVTTEFADENWVFHLRDAERFKEYYNKTPDYVVPICGFSPRIDNKSISNKYSRKKKVLLFVCSLYRVNAKGFKWFYRNVFPELSGDFEILIVGNGSKRIDRFVRDNRITIIGKVDSLSEYYENADIVINPVFLGGGMKVKTWEAISYGKCIVSTSESLNGYWEELDENIKNRLVFRLDDSASWINTINSLIKTEIRKTNPEIIEVFQRSFSYERMRNDFERKLGKYNG